jgi:deoxyribodipyrimidine photolyase-related protein
MHRASMKFYEEYLLKNEIEVEYFEDESYLELYKDDSVMFYDVADDYLHKKITQNFSSFSSLKNPNFLNVDDDSKFFHKFYINRRKELNIFLDEAKNPLGGKWSFDSQNRKKLPKGEKPPITIAFENKYTDEAKKYCQKFTSTGELEDIYYPVTYTEAK